MEMDRTPPPDGTALVADRLKSISGSSERVYEAPDGYLQEIAAAKESLGLPDVVSAPKTGSTTSATELKSFVLDNVAYVIVWTLVQTLLNIFLLTSEPPPPGEMTMNEADAKFKTLNAETFEGDWVQGASKLTAIGELNHALDCGGHDVNSVYRVNAQTLEGRVIQPSQPFVTQVGVLSAPLDMGLKNIIHGGRISASQGFVGEYQPTVPPSLQRVGALTTNLNVQQRNVVSVTEIPTSTTVLHASTLSSQCQANIHQIGVLDEPWQVNGHQLVDVLQVWPGKSLTVTFSHPSIQSTLSHPQTAITGQVFWQQYSGNLEEIGLSLNPVIYNRTIPNSDTHTFRFAYRGFYVLRLNNVQVTDTVVWGWLRSVYAAYVVTSALTEHVVSRRTWALPANGYISDCLIVYLDEDASLCVCLDNGVDAVTFMNASTTGSLHITRLH